jgi:hypothetical protein
MVSQNEDMIINTSFQEYRATYAVLRTSCFVACVRCGLHGRTRWGNPTAAIMSRGSTNKCETRLKEDEILCCSARNIDQNEKETLLGIKVLLNGTLFLRKQ